MLDDGYTVKHSVDITIKDSVFKTDKTSYTVGDPIKVTATGSGDAWVGLYKKGETPASSLPSYFWYYIDAEGHSSGSTYTIQNQTAGRGGDLSAGSYVLYYFPDGSYNYTKSINISISSASVSLSTNKTTY